MTKSGDPGTAYQLTLFALEAVATAAPTTHDRDKVDHQLTCHKVDNSASAPGLPLAQEHFTVPEQQTGDAAVLEQDTQEALPIVEYLEKIAGVVLERDTKNAVPEHTQWVEEYRPSTRKGHLYYRYCYKQSRKIKHIHIPGGNTRSHLAQNRKSQVEIAIASGNSPGEIRKLISSWKCDRTPRSAGTH
ncbi:MULTISPECIES: hypothetical protein [unclassified Tolypothrix]|uniref:hypothetical protein n=1 Tax=unclassified Tolypothrix TaxID=2649714 RepID=UPI0005EABD5F|nr:MULTISPECIES: hypothetical protein [unclassified Tolypothrix]BAY89651.1 hypothetical protein NIES3275_16540 [Microchaete diplosiphon NIES-3275]EKE97653.1 hypothetical protein FDUTEX481_05031 [Tolypothrix sp. PCC 7601]MBE9083229.1 hypothetical protein [Tolypothrix sp. LEGE 11397]UYD23921.1 hypothetical protein HGR01_20690 [Tolypothrix sp. PCC 7712]UYD33853.1 hypothetical protein HG267_34060 [Tolypothrix sp. PCC 7601]